jgi:D-glycerate 3-kinase
LGASVADIAALLARRADGFARRGKCFIVGLSGAQGSGKSTLAAELQRLLQRRGFACVSMSLDDFYLTHEQRSTLASREHPLLQTRGVPGTHDIALALEVIEALQRRGEVALPSFDKARDDRRPRREWQRVHAPMQIVLFEGWCLGAPPQSADELAQPINALEREEDVDGAWRRGVNVALAGEYQGLFEKLDELVFIAAPGFEIVQRWRLEQENELRRLPAQPGGDRSRMMDDAALERFVSHFERLTRHMLECMPARAHILVRLDSARAMTLVPAALDEAREQ